VALAEVERCDLRFSRNPIIVSVLDAAWDRQVRCNAGDELLFARRIALQYQPHRSVGGATMRLPL
jgi:hypothetical protein